MNFVLWFTLLASIVFLASLAAVAIVNAWRSFCDSHPDEAFAIGAVGVVSLGVIGAVFEAVRP